MSQRAAHVAWAWVAEMEEKGVLEGREGVPVERMMQNGGGVMPCWRKRSRAMSGYGEGKRVTREEVNVVRMVEKVYRALKRQVRPEEEEARLMEEEGQVGEVGALWVEVCHQRRAWHAVKNSPEFREGGREMFWRCLGILLLEGRVEGHLGKGPKDGDWWGEAMGVWGRLGLKEGGEGEGEGEEEELEEEVEGFGVLSMVQGKETVMEEDGQGDLQGMERDEVTCTVMEKGSVGSVEGVGVLPTILEEEGERAEHWS